MWLAWNTLGQQITTDPVKFTAAEIIIKHLSQITKFQQQTSEQHSILRVVLGVQEFVLALIGLHDQPGQNCEIRARKQRLACSWKYCRVFTESNNRVNLPACPPCTSSGNCCNSLVLQSVAGVKGVWEELTSLSFQSKCYWEWSWRTERSWM